MTYAFQIKTNMCKKVLNNMLKSTKGCLWIVETITILSKGLNIIQNNLYSHQVLHIWKLWLNYLTAAFHGYDPLAFWRLIPQLHVHRSTFHNVCVNCTVFSSYHSIALHQNYICVNTTDMLAFMWKTKCNTCKKFRGFQVIHKPGVRNKNTTLMWFAAVYFSFFFRR